jgi:hypothetical protein
MLLDQRRSLILDFEEVYVTVSQITVSCAVCKVCIPALSQMIMLVDMRCTSV